MVRPGPSPTFRLAEEADGAAIAVLLAAAYGEAPEMVADPTRDGRAWVAEVDGVLVGCVGYQPVEDGAIALRWLAVAPDARGRGLGRQLIGIVLTEARGAGARHVDARCDTRFATALDLFAMLGFVESAKPAAGEGGRGPVTCLMRKAL